MQVAALKTLGGQTGSVINWLDTWYLSAFMPGTVNAAKLLLGLTLTRELEGKAPGIVHLGADTAFPFLGPSAGDTYNPFTGEGGLIIKVVKRKEEKPPECFPKKQLKKTKVNTPVNITLLGHSFRRDKKGKPLPLRFDKGQGPRSGRVDGLPQSSKRNVKVTYTPRQDTFGTESFTFKVNDGRKSSRKECTVEIEVSDLAQLRDALTGAPDIIMLDNMSCAGMKKSVALRNKIDKKVKLEASGNITEKNITSVAACGVDFVSLGVLTHSIKCADFSLKIK